jgi:DNA-binding LacI/PurR family transcriptional regulator
MNVTQKMIADQVGVSQRAVAYALSDSPKLQAKLRPETRQRILDAATRLGYRPSRSAQMLRNRKSGLIGMIQRGGMHQVSILRTFFAAQAVYRSGFNLLTNDVLWNEDGMRTACEAMLDARVEGVLIMNTEIFPANLETLQRAGIPIVQVAGTRLPGVPQVRSDTHQGMRDLTKHLLDLGYRRLVLLTAWPNPAMRASSADWPVVERQSGFQETMKGMGEVIFEETPFDWMKPYEQGRISMTRILQRAERPEAVLCSNDDWAVGALRACAAAGVRVPEDIALTGFDGACLAECSMVPVTTMAQKPKVLAQTAVAMLVRMIKGETISAEEDLIKVPCHLVVRQSCGAVLRQSPQEINAESQ